jgi:hypothetical protein
MGTVQCQPKPWSYTIEWVALQFDPSEGIVSMKKLLRGTDWSIAEATINGAESQVVCAKGGELWRLNPGDWVIRTPYDKVWFMGDTEFQTNFDWRPE